MTNKQSTYNSVDIKDKLWEKAKIIPNKNKNLYRKDPNGDILYKKSISKYTNMGSEIDHIKPKSKGGSDNIRNLQLLKTSSNRSKSNSLVKASRHSKSNK
jgi:5-methylcytosine-specific restriction endonuclease McrA